MFLIMLTKDEFYSKTEDIDSSLSKVSNFMKIPTLNLSAIRTNQLKPKQDLMSLLPVDFVDESIEKHTRIK